MNNYVIAPESDIYLLKCPLEIDSLNQLDFATATAQYNYFQSLTKVLMDDATYVRKESRIYFEGSYDTLCTYNYCMYRNTNYSNKWFYAFISDMRYESNNSVSADLTTDVFQTWMFDIVYHPTFIERMHVAKSSDVIGAWLVPEDFELGDYVCNDTDDITDLKAQSIVVGSTADYTDISLSVTGVYQGIPTGCAYYSAPKTTSGIAYVKNFLQTLTDATKESAITSLFLAPSWLCPYASGQSGDLKKITDSETVAIFDETVSTAVTGLDTYQPKNNKLYQYPYYFVQVTNGAGGVSVIKPQLWNGSTHTLRIYGALSPGCSIVAVPMAYDGYDIAWENALPLAKYPQLNYSTDQYVNWQTQNGLNNTWQEISGIAGAVVGAGQITSAIGGAVAGGGDWSGASGDLMRGGSNYFGGIYQITDAVNQRHLAELIPAQFKGNANSGDVWSASNNITFRINFMSVKRDTARRIDKYFDMFGYKINEYTTTIQNNMKSRSKWNFIKTIDINLTGDIPQNDIQRLKNIFNNGFTIWHDPTHFLDYSQTNS